MFIKHGDNQPITKLLDLTELDEKKAQQLLEQVKEKTVKENESKDKDQK